MKLIVLVLVLAACQTQFTGEPTIPNGPNGCVAICQRWNMDMVGMFAVGEYSDGCICQIRFASPNPTPAPGQPASAPSAQIILPAVRGAIASAPAMAGVVMQMRRAQQQRQQAH